MVLQQVNSSARVGDFRSGEKFPAGL